MENILGKKCSKEELMAETTQIFHEIGLPSHIKGYEYLRTAIVFVVEQCKVPPLVLKDLYPHVAKQYFTNVACVERLIRYAIEITWGCGDADMLNSYFGYAPKSKHGRPTSSEFIAIMVDHLRLKYRLY